MQMKSAEDQREKGYCAQNGRLHLDSGSSLYVYHPDAGCTAATFSGSFPATGRRSTLSAAVNAEGFFIRPGTRVASSHTGAAVVSAYRP